MLREGSWLQECRKVALLPLPILQPAWPQSWLSHRPRGKEASCRGLQPKGEALLSLSYS